MVLAILGQRLEVKLRAAETGGALGATEAVIEPGWEGPPAHIHHREDEAVYVLEGELEFTVAGTLHPAPAGTLVHIPRGARHAWRNVSDRQSRSLTIYTPGGFEAVFDRVDAGTPIAALAADYGLELPAA